MNAVLTASLLEQAAQITEALQRAARFEANAEYERGAGYTRAAVIAENAAAATIAELRESPSLARLRAAVILLDGITDELIGQVTTADCERLIEVLRRLDAGEL